jgi:hypothetical protein
LIWKLKFASTEVQSLSVSSAEPRRVLDLIVASELSTGLIGIWIPTDIGSNNLFFIARLFPEDTPDVSAFTGPSPRRQQSAKEVITGLSRVKDFALV